MLSSIIFILFLAILGTSVRDLEHRPSPVSVQKIWK